MKYFISETSWVLWLNYFSTIITWLHLTWIICFSVLVLLTRKILFHCLLLHSKLAQTLAFIIWIMALRLQVDWSRGLMMASYSHLVFCKCDQKMGLNWACWPEYLYVAIQHDGLGAVRLMTWQLTSLRASFQRELDRASKTSMMEIWKSQNIAFSTL